MRLLGREDKQPGKEAWTQPCFLAEIIWVTGWCLRDWRSVHYGTQRTWLPVKQFTDAWAPDVIWNSVLRWGEFRAWFSLSLFYLASSLLVTQELCCIRIKIPQKATHPFSLLNVDESESIPSSWLSTEQLLRKERLRVCYKLLYQLNARLSRLLSS